MGKGRQRESEEVFSRLEAADKAFIEAVAMYIVELRRQSPPDLEVREATAREALFRLSVHHQELLDDEIERLLSEEVN